MRRRAHHAKQEGDGWCWIAIAAGWPSQILSRRFPRIRHNVALNSLSNHDRQITTMQTVTVLLALIAATCVVGCGTASHGRDYSGTPATDIAVTVSCSRPTMGFAGTIVSDGQSRQLSGVGSGTFHATGHEFLCSFQKTEADGVISISASQAGVPLGGVGTPRGGVRAELLRTPWAQHTLFTSF